MIFQESYETLNPRFMIFETIDEPLKTSGIKDKDESLVNDLQLNNVKQ